MLKTKWTHWAMLALVLPAAGSYAQQDSSETDQRSGFAIAGDLGTLGYGGSLFYKLNDYFVLRGSVSSGSVNREFEEEDITYDGTLELENSRLGLDIYPFKGTFRLSAAYGDYGNRIDLVAVPTGGTIEINDEQYETDKEITSLNGSITSPSNATYLGMGWGNPVADGKGFGMMLDLGVMMLDEPDVQLTAICPDSSLSCHSLQSDVDIEQAKLQEDFNDAYTFWPVINIAISYQF